MLSLVVSLAQAAKVKIMLSTRNKARILFISFFPSNNVFAGDNEDMIPQATDKCNMKARQTLLHLAGLAGALGLEPRAYGFGDEADKSASGGTSFEVNISTFQKQIAAAITKTDSKIKQIGNFINKPTVFWVYGLLCRNRRLRKYIIIR